MQRKSEVEPSVLRPMPSPLGIMNAAPVTEAFSMNG